MIVRGSKSLLSLILSIALWTLFLPWVVGSSSYAQADQSTVVVDAQEISQHFPDNIDFTLRAHGFEASRAELNFSLVGEPVTSGEQADVDSSASNLDLKVTLDLSTHYIPPGAEVAYYWALTDDAERTAYTPQKTFTMRDERHQWQDLTDAQQRVSVHWYDGDRAFGNALIDTASRALDRLQHDIGASLQRPANIWVYANQDELIDALPKNIPEWVGGQAFPELSLVLASISNDETADQETKRVEPHELSHLLLYQATRNPYNTPPAWMDEGLAVHNQEAQDPAEEEALQNATEEGRLVPLKALAGSFGADEEAALLSYAESRSVVDFIVSDSRYGPAKLSRSIAEFRKGVTYDDALKAGLGVTVDEIDREWRASLPYKVAAPGAAPAPKPATKGGTRPAFDLSPTGPVALVALGMCAGLFMAGALLTAVMLVRRRNA